VADYRKKATKPGSVCALSYP